ncbi:hypothetical protein BJX65DRAFT_286177 [Aspergillus insuetus]
MPLSVGPEQRLHSTKCQGGTRNLDASFAALSFTFSITTGLMFCGRAKTTRTLRRLWNWLNPDRPSEGCQRDHPASKRFIAQMRGSVLSHGT